MAAFTVASNEVGVWEKTLTGSTVDAVTFTGGGAREVVVTNVDGAAAIYFTIDGPDPTVGAQRAYWLPAVAGAVRTVRKVAPLTGATVVRVISVGTPKYSVEVA